MKTLISAFALAALALPLWPQDVSGGRLRVSLADPSRPAQLVVSSINGRITVHGTDRNDIAVLPRGGDSHHDRSDGMRRIDTGHGGLSLSQTGNVVTIGTGAPYNSDLTLEVPVSTSLNLKSVMGDVDVDNIAGDIEAGSTNGRIRLTNVSGAAVLHGVNGNIVAVFTHIPSDKPMSFSTLNGEIDITLPADARATLKMKTTNGDAYTDFDMTLHSGGNTAEGTGGGFRRHTAADHTITGTINGGGPEIQVVTFNGSIKIRKGH